MRIQWCEVHEQTNRPNTLGCWIGYDLWEESGKRENPNCALIPMHLVPDNPETVERIETAIRTHSIKERAVAVLDAFEPAEED